MSVSHQLTVTEAAAADRPDQGSAGGTAQPDGAPVAGPDGSASGLMDTGQPSVTFEPHRDKIELTMPKLGPDLDRKGKHIRFLEQAFEWHHLSYVFYPYFWAPTTRWVDTSNRQSERDPVFESFLRSGAARALVAVTKDFEAAVLHFLATGEPWEGGIATTIDDPLFVPLYDEIMAKTKTPASVETEGAPWNFEIPTRLVYLERFGTKLEEVVLAPLTNPDQETGSEEPDEPA